MERVVRGRSFTLSQSFYSDGVLVTPTGTPTVAIVRVSDGTTVTVSAVAGTGTGPYTVTVTAANNALLDTLTVTWTATISGQANTYTDKVEVAGDVLFSIAEARAVAALASPTTYPTADIADMRTTVEQAIEQACARAFVPRYERETLDGTGGTTVMLKRPLVSSIRSASIGGTALSVGDVALLAFSGTGALYNASGWTCGTGNVIVGYEHGTQDPPMEIRRAALLLAKTWLVGRSSPVDDRATTFASAEGGTYGLVVAGRGGSMFGVPDVDTAIDRYSMNVGIA